MFSIASASRVLHETMCVGTYKASFSRQLRYFSFLILFSLECGKWSVFAIQATYTYVGIYGMRKCISAYWNAQIILGTG